MSSKALTAQVGALKFCGGVLCRQQNLSAQMESAFG